jgi:membrane-bound lytic murein transglycosylase D
MDLLKTWIAVFLLLLPMLVRAQDTVPVEDLLKDVQGWVEANADDNWWETLGLDQGRVRQFLTELQKRFQGYNVYDLGSLQDSATQLLPVLEQFEEAQPYALWLQTHLDYFKTANDLRQQGSVGTNTPAAPTPAAQRKVWVKELENRPLPSPARKFVPRLKPLFAAEKVPVELVWLAEVESSFNPQARSPMGAAGLYQFMPATAKRFNLSTFPIDERLDPEKSARAAAKYLQILYRRFGDWRLALAAYNSGEQRVENLLKGGKTRSFDVIASRLPAETQMYVPKFEAVLLRREGKTLSSL